MPKKTTKKVGKPQKTEVPPEGKPLKEATVLEFTGKPNGKVELLVEVDGKHKTIVVDGEYKDFKVGQKI